MRKAATRIFVGLLLTCTASVAHATHFPPGAGTCLDSLLVYNIQNPAAACYAAIGDTVFGLSGIVTGFDKIPTGFGLYIQNNASGANGSPWTGADVFTGGSNIAVSLGLVVGDSIAIGFSSVTEFGGGTEVLSPNNSFSTPNITIRKVAGVTLAHPIPAFHIGTAGELQELPTNPNAEQWEGCLVRVEGPLRVVRTSATGGLGSNNSFLCVDDIVCSTGPCDSLFVDGNILTTYAPPPVGNVFDAVQGIYEQRSRGYRIQLRDGNDIQTATPPSVTDAFPVYDNRPALGPGATDSIMVVFDRAVDKVSAEDLSTDTYTMTSFSPVIGATRLNAPDDNRVIIAITSGLVDGDAEGVTVNHVKGRINGLAMLTAQSRTFFNGVMTIKHVQAPDTGPSGLGGSPCVDRSAFAGAGAIPGDRFSYRGVVTKGFGNLYYLQDVGGGVRSGMSEFAPIAPLIEGHKYLVAGSVQEFFEETEGTNNVYLRDEGVAAVPAPVIRPLSSVRDTSCDAGQSVANGEDYEGMLVKIEKVEIAQTKAAGHFFPVRPVGVPADTMDISVQAGNFTTFAATEGHIATITGVLRFPFGRFSIYPRSDADIIDWGADATRLGVGGGGPKELSFAVGPNPGQAQDISFGLPKAAPIEIGIYDLAGRRVAIIAKGDFPAGSFSRKWNGLDAQGNAVGAGMYFYKLRVGSETRMVRAIRLN